MHKRGLMQLSPKLSVATMEQHDSKNQGIAFTQSLCFSAGGDTAE